jgi:hypothetical protein
VDPKNGRIVVLRRPISLGIRDRPLMLRLANVAVPPAIRLKAQPKQTPAWTRYAMLP